MHLISLSVSGFKSFAEKTTVEFLPPKDGRFSITGIVGPNGSGKSNISDAIRWVMGEQRMKHLRGKKGEDIIFGGSDSKGKMSAASVTLTLDNTDGIEEIDTDQIVITRKYYRSGDSEYLINNKKVRLLDVQLLLAKAQCGQGSYSVVGQGMIDRLILQTPEERKAFFDEAAGIKEYQIKRHQSVLKLRRSKEHMEQADLLLQEITPRLKSLSRQVKKLEQRQEVELTLREKQEAYYVTLWSSQTSLLHDAQSALGEISKEYAKVEGELTTVQEELAGLAQAASRQDVFAGLQRDYQDLVRKKNDAERERAVLQGRIQTGFAKEGKHNIPWLEQKVESLNEQLSQKQIEAKQIEESVAKMETEIQSLKESLANMQLERTQLTGSLSRLQQEQSQKRNEQSLWQLTGKRAVQEILRERKQFGRVEGAVAQLGRVKKEYQLALDVAAGGHLSSIVVRDDLVAQRCIEYLRNHQLGFATFLPLNKIRPRPVPRDIDDILNEPGVHGLAIDLVQFDDLYKDIFSYVLGATVVVENITAARNIGIGRIRMVTLDGDIMETSGSMKGGSRKKRNYGLSFADAGVGETRSEEVYEEELKKTEEALTDLQSDITGADTKLRELEAQCAVAKEKGRLCESLHQQLTSERSGFEQELSLSTVDPKQYSAVMKDLAKKKKETDKQISSIEKEIAAAEKKITAFNEEEEKKQQRVFALQDVMQQTQQTLNGIVSQKNEREVVIAKLETKIEDIEQEAYLELRESVPDVAGRTEEIVSVASLEQLQAEVQKLKYKLSLIGGIDEEVVEEYQETKSRHEQLSGEMEDLTKAVADLESLIAELDAVMKKKRDKAFKEIKKEFKRYFKLLFEGGKADLVEVFGYEEESEDELEENAEEETEQEPKKRRKKMLKGIDIVASPPGKKIVNIQVLSGGERTMTSIALLCAILHTNPAPFVVLDEVEAALDEANTVRFTKILFELANQSQFVLITHNKATMHATDALYGVTMGGDGISKLVSVNMTKAS